jgi:hypothetical protein
LQEGKPTMSSNDYVTLKLAIILGGDEECKEIRIGRGCRQQLSLQ